MKKIFAVIFLICLFSKIFPQSYIIKTIAGIDSSGYSGDGGLAIAAKLYTPYGIAIDNSGNIYIGDSYNFRIRKINSGGIITTVAGNGTSGYSGDGGFATSAEISLSFGIAISDSGNLYIADGFNNCIREVNRNGIISTIAGDGIGGYSGDGGLATSAELYLPAAITLDDSGNVYIADVNNERIRKVNTHGIISTVAGNGYNSNNNGGYSGDGGPAISAELGSPSGISLDDSGNIYIADMCNNVIRKVNANGIISTIAGNGYMHGVWESGGFSGDGGFAINAELFWPEGVIMDASGIMYIADRFNNRIRQVNMNGTISTIAGTGTASYSGDGGQAILADLNAPSQVVVDKNGNIYIADQVNSCIRKLSVPTGIYSMKDHAMPINIYPNPSTGKFTIAYSLIEPAAFVIPLLTIEIYSITGQKILVEPVQQFQGNNTINLNSQPNGVYLYKIIIGNNMLQEGKLIIQK